MSQKSNFSVPLFLSLYFSLVLFNMFAFDCQGADVFLEKLIVTLIIVLLSYLLCKFVNFLFYPQKSYLLVSSALSNEEPFDVYWLDVLTTLDAAFWLILPLTKLILEASPVSPSNTFFNVSASALCNTFSSMERLPSFACVIPMLFNASLSPAGISFNCCL